MSGYYIKMHFGIVLYIITKGYTTADEILLNRSQTYLFEIISETHRIIHVRTYSDYFIYHVLIAYFRSNAIFQFCTFGSPRFWTLFSFGFLQDYEPRWYSKLRLSTWWVYLFTIVTLSCGQIRRKQMLVTMQCNG